MYEIRTKHPNDDADYYLGPEPKTGCPHIHTEYQAPEPDSNVIEGMVCLDCNEELPIPEPDFDLIGKEENL